MAPLIHLCMLCLMLYYGIFISFHGFGGAVVTSSYSPSTSRSSFFSSPDLLDLFRRESYGDQSFIVSYQKFNFGEVPICRLMLDTALIPTH